jgi:hypothetical protein
MTRMYTRVIFMAGYTGSASNSLFIDFILVAKKLEQLGFTYCKGTITIIHPLRVR